MEKTGENKDFSRFLDGNYLKKVKNIILKIKILINDKSDF